MKKEMNNKGFSLVELIIVVAIMAVLIGVLAPTYLKYVENSKKTSDCSAIGSILDAVEVIAVDPMETTWVGSTAGTSGFTVTWSNGTATYGGNGTVEGLVEEIASASKASLKSSWASATNFKIEAKKYDTGKVIFELTGPVTKAEIGLASPALEARLD